MVCVWSCTTCLSDAWVFAIFCLSQSLSYIPQHYVSLLRQHTRANYVSIRFQVAGGWGSPWSRVLFLLEQCELYCILYLFYCQRLGHILECATQYQSAVERIPVADKMSDLSSRSSECLCRSYNIPRTGSDLGRSYRVCDPHVLRLCRLYVFIRWRFK